MPTTKAQAAQRERFLAAYFDGAPELRGKLKESALAAGYSWLATKAKQKKLRAIIADETLLRNRMQRDENRATRRSPISGQLLPRWYEDANGGAPCPIPPQPPQLAKQETNLPPWCRDRFEGADQRLYFDLDGRPKTLARSVSLADSYQVRFMSIDGGTHLAGESTRPAWIEPDFSDLFPEPEREPGFVDEKRGDALGDPDALPQARLSPDEGPTNEIFSQMTR